MDHDGRIRSSCHENDFWKVDMEQIYGVYIYHTNEARQGVEHDDMKAGVRSLFPLSAKCEVRDACSVDG